MNQYQVESILDKKIDKKTKNVWYHIKWIGYEKSQSSWQPKENLANCQQLIEQYQKKRMRSSLREDANQFRTKNSVKKCVVKSDLKLAKKSQIFDLQENPSYLIQEISLNQKKPYGENNLFMKKQIHNNQENDQIKISGIKRNGSSYQICINQNNKKEWKEHSWVKNNFPKQLCSFYEKFIVFDEQ